MVSRSGGCYHVQAQENEMPIGSDVGQTTYASVRLEKPKEERNPGTGKRRLIGVTLKQLRKKQQDPKSGKIKQA